MISFKFNNNPFELDFNGIKVIITKYTTNFIKSIFSNEHYKITIDGRHISWKNVIYVNDLSKVDDFVSLGKNSFIQKMIIDYLGDLSLINQDVVNEIIEKINESFQINDLLQSQYDLSKIIASSFELNDLGYIDDDKLFKILKALDCDERKLIIFDNVKFVKYTLCKEILNKYDILIVTSDIRGTINNISELELCCFIDDNNCFEVMNSDRLISYLELKMSEHISNSDINDYLNYAKNKKSLAIDFYLKTI